MYVQMIVAMILHYLDISSSCICIYNS